MSFIIYWEKNADDLNGFVSYDNKFPTLKNEYQPVSFRFASVYSTRKLAEKTRDWYVKRGGFGLFKIMEVKE